MEQLLLCGAIILLQIILYVIIGNDLCKCLKWEKKGLITILVGFFGYFGLFQIIVLPLILLKQPFHVLVILWGMICVLILIKCIFWNRKEVWKNLGTMKQELVPSQKLLLLGVLVLAVFAVVYQAIHYYTGFDAAFYVGTVNTTLYTDSMYIYDGETGRIENYLNMRYLLSGFYMNTAFWCRIMGVAPMMAQNYGMGSICILMMLLISFLIGKKIFGENTEKAYIYTGIIIILNFLFVSGYTSADFLLYRGYEAKGFCANVVIPAVFYAILKLWEDTTDKKRWWLLFIIAFSSVPISMSSILIVPVMLGIITLAECLVLRKLYPLWYGIVCMIPNGVYLILYFLYTQKLWQIMI